MYKAYFTKLAQKGAKIAKQKGFRDRISEMMKDVRRAPLKPAPGQCFEKLEGYDPPVYTRRVTRRDRLVYTIEPNTENETDENGVPYEGIVVVHRVWGHFP